MTWYCWRSGCKWSGPLSAAFAPSYVDPDWHICPKCRTYDSLHDEEAATDAGMPREEAERKTVKEP